MFFSPMSGDTVTARLREHYYGGWVAPGIYYMGAAGVLRVGCLRIAGISGSFASGDLVKRLVMSRKHVGN